MEDKNYIEQLFSTKLKDAEVPVNPELWTKISAGISSASATSVGLISTKILTWVAATIGLAGIGTIIYFSQPKKNKNEIVSEQKLEVNSEKVEINKTESSSKQKITKSINKEEKIVQNSIESNSSETTLLLEKEFEQLIQNQDSKSEIIDPVDVLPTKNLSTIEDHKIQNQSVNSSISKIPKSIETEQTEDFLEEKQLIEKREINLPTVFSPNQDGVEDDFYIKNLEEISDFQIVILNDLNEVVFQSNELSFKWDGRNQSGDLVKKGNYVYFLTGINPDGSKFNKASRLMIHR